MCGDYYFLPSSGKEITDYGVWATCQLQSICDLVQNRPDLQGLTANVKTETQFKEPEGETLMTVGQAESILCVLRKDEFLL